MDTVGPRKNVMFTKLQTVAVLWTLLVPARKMQNNHFFPLGPKPSIELAALAVLTTVHRTASVGISDPGFFHRSELPPSAVLIIFRTSKDQVDRCVLIVTFLKVALLV